MNKYELYITVISALVVLITILFPIDNVFYQGLRIFFGSIFILFLSGYWLTKSFFYDDEIDFFERFALSFSLSISVVPLVSFYLNLVWVKITALSVYLIVLVIILVNTFYLSFFRRNKYVESK